MNCHANPLIQWHRHSCLCCGEKRTKGHRQECLCHQKQRNSLMRMPTNPRVPRLCESCRWTSQKVGLPREKMPCGHSHGSQSRGTHFAIQSGPHLGHHSTHSSTLRRVVFHEAPELFRAMHATLKTILVQRKFGNSVGQLLQFSPLLNKPPHRWNFPVKECIDPLRGGPRQWEGFEDT